MTVQRYVSTRLGSHRGEIHWFEHISSHLLSPSGPNAQLPSVVFKSWLNLGSMRALYELYTHVYANNDASTQLPKNQSLDLAGFLEGLQLHARHC